MIGVGTFKITDRARKYVNEVLNSERLSYGYFTQRFENLFATAHDSRFAVMTNSGTSSLQIALAVLRTRHGWQDGDEVIVPAVTFIATPNIVLQNGMKPVFVDVDPTYYELDPSKIEAAITPRTRCIIPVHLFGGPCDMETIMAIAQKHSLRVIEDSCETMFARQNGRSVGAFGDIGCFSTYVAHILTTGVGGLCTTNDPDLAVQLRSMMNHGRDSIYLNIDDDKDKSKSETELIIQRRFSFVQLGYSYRVTEMEGALGLAEFEGHEAMMKKRWGNGQFFMDRLRKFSDQLQVPTVRQGCDHAFMMLPLVLKTKKKRDLVNYLEFNGIETRDMLPLTNQPFYRKHLGINEDDFPVAKWINENGFYIGCHQNLSDIERDYMVEIIESYFTQGTLKKEKACLILMSKGDSRPAQTLYATLPIATFDEKIFVEGGTDLSATDFFAKKGFQIIAEPRGKGELLKKAIAQTQCEHILVMGTDGSDNPEDIPRVMIRLKQGFDLVIASRFMTGGGRVTKRRMTYRSIGNRFFSFLLSVIFNENISDCNNMFRGFRKSAVEGIKLSENGESIMFEMTVRALDTNLSLGECPTTERPAVVNRRRRNRFYGALTFCWVLLRVKLKSRHSK